MGIVTPPPQPAPLHLNPPKPSSRTLAEPNSSMSQGFHQGIFSFSDGFDRSASQEQQQHIAQQSRRDKLRVQGFDPAGHPLVPIEEEGEEPSGIYEAPGPANMLSEMFNFPTAGPSSTELLANQISAGYRLQPRPASVSGFASDWYAGNRPGGVVLSSGLSSLGDAAAKHHHDSSGQQQQQPHAMPGLNADSAAAMQLFLMSPPAGAAAHPSHRSPSPPPPAPAAAHPSLHHHQAFQAASFGDTSFGGGVVEGQGLSLSLSSSLQQFEVGKAEDPRVRDAVLYFNTQQPQQQQQPQHSSSLHFAQGQHSQPGQGHGQLHMGYGAVGVVNVLRASKYARAAQELLEEFCSVGRGQLKGGRVGRHQPAGSSNPNPNSSGGGGGAGASSSAAAGSSSSKDLPPLSPADRFEHQRKKTKLLAMLDEARIEPPLSLSLSPA